MGCIPFAEGGEGHEGEPAGEKGGGYIQGVE